MVRYIIRLDDASPTMDRVKWNIVPMNTQSEIEII